jgi:hypothetical protein
MYVPKAQQHNDQCFLISMINFGNSQAISVMAADQKPACKPFNTARSTSDIVGVVSAGCLNAFRSKLDVMTTETANPNAPPTLLNVERSPAGIVS